MSQRVMLVRHAEPIVRPDQPASSWRLGPKGGAQAVDLAMRLFLHGPDLVVTSTEQKARDTGAIIAAELHLDCRNIDGFHEQGADTVPCIDDPAEFRETVRQHFEHLDHLVLGSESSHDAAIRSRESLNLVGERFPVARLPLIVSHGRVMASFLGDLTGHDPWKIWTGLTMPDLVRVDLGAGRFEHLGGGGAPDCSPVAYSGVINKMP